MKIDIKRLDDRAIIPAYGSSGSAGADLFAVLDDDVVINPGETVFVNTGIALAIPNGYVGLIFARSGLASKLGVAPANKVGVIDSDYRGEIMVALHNHSKESVSISSKQKIAQFVVVPYYKLEFNEVSNLSSTVRGSGGFGSTGK